MYSLLTAGLQISLIAKVLKNKSSGVIHFSLATALPTVVFGLPFFFLLEAREFMEYVTLAPGEVREQNACSTRSHPLQIVLRTACLYGRGACADFAQNSAALVKRSPTEWWLPLCFPLLKHERFSLQVAVEGHDAIHAFFYLTIGAVMALAYNMTRWAVVQHTSSLFLAMVGNFKIGALVALSSVLFDEKLTQLNQVNKDPQFAIVQGSSV